MSSHNQTIPDAEFIRLFKELGSPTAVAKKLGVNVRNVYSRRARLQSVYNVNLTTTNDMRVPMSKIEHSGRVMLDIKDGIVIVFSDAHYWPDTISTAHRALLKFIEHLKPVAVVCNGDAFDGGSISRFPRIGWDNKPSVKDELQAVTDRLGEIEAASKGRLIWTLGNHDARYETKLAASAPEFEGVGGFCLKDHFPRWSPCWSAWIGDHTVIKHRFRGGVHATHNNTVNGGVNFITGHLHSLKITPFSDYRGTRFGVDTGTLASPCGMQFLDYSEDNPKNHRSGFAVLTFKDGKLLWPELAHVMDEDEGTVCFRGAIAKF